MRTRRMRAEDLDQVFEIEKLSFSRPWSPESFFAKPAGDECVQLVSVDQNRITGFVIGWVEGPGLHIVNLAVHPGWRRKGIGRHLIETLINRQPASIMVWLEVRCSNKPARTLYDKMGFAEIGVRINYYPEEGEDAVLMAMTTGRDHV